MDAISIFLCNHPQFYECIIQLFVGNEVISIPEVICSYANNRNLLCLLEERIYIKVGPLKHEKEISCTVISYLS